MTPRSPTSARPGHGNGQLLLDREGRWFHEGVQVTHERTCALFFRNLRLGHDGSYYVLVGAERASVEVEDTPYLVRSVTIVEDERGTPREYRLHLNDGTEEPLAPHTLAAGADHALYCAVKNTGERARFLRPAYYQLCGRLESDEDLRSFWLPLNSGRVRVATPEGDSGEE